MKTTISLSKPSRKASSANTLSMWLASGNRLFSYIMSQGEEEKVTVTNRQALYIFQALISGSLLCCSVFVNILAALVVAFWFILSLLLCKEGGLK